MKHFRRTFKILGFFFEYLLPIIIFGKTFPLTHGNMGAGLTKAGFLALGVILVILAKKAKEYVVKITNPHLREMILSLFPIVFWAVVFAGLNSFYSIVTAVLAYWSRLIIFILIGRVFYVMATYFEEESKDNDKLPAPAEKEDNDK